MATIYIAQQPTPLSLLPRIPKSKAKVSTVHPWKKFSEAKKYSSRFIPPRHVHNIGVGKQSLGLLEDDQNPSMPQIKMKLYQAVEGINRGVFGVTAVQKTEIEGLVEQLESQNPTQNPTSNLDKVAGSWKVLYSTIKILGSKRTKLGLRDFITLGDFWQHINVDMGKAVNVIEFNPRGLSLLKGQLTIEATFVVASESRVSIKYRRSSITPEQLMKVFKQNYELLISIFNPDGWLEITYLDDTLRIGRDDKGNIFILER
ncbi:hypothetical protein Dimus_017729 [Dionaea muscipula]